MVYLTKLNIITQSAVYTVKRGINGEKGMRCESSAITVGVCAKIFLYLSVKAGHWETEKAGYRNAGIFPIWRESQDLLWCYLAKYLKK